MTEKRRPIVYIGFGLGCFLVFFYWLFPLDMVADQALEQAKKGLPGFDIRIDKVKPSVLFATELVGVKISSKDGATAALTPIASFKKLAVNPALISLARGKVAFSVTGSDAMGEFSADVVQSGAQSTVALSFDGIGPGSLPYLKESLRLNMTGHLYGTAKLTWDSENMSRSDGEFDVEFREFVIQPSKLKIQGLDVDLPKVRFSGKNNSFLRASLQKGKLQLKQLDLLGEDMEVSLGGRIPFNKKLAQSHLFLKGSLQISEELTKALPFLALIEKQKTTEGNYPISISGTLEKPQIRIGRMNLPM